MKLLKKIRYFIPCIIIIVDLWIKTFFRNYFYWNKTFQYFPYISLKPMKNFGIGLSLFENTIIQKYLPIILSGILLIFIYEWMQLSNKESQIGGGFIIGGGTANLIDRIKYGYVLDYLKINLFGNIIFNFADIAICFGIIYSIYKTIKNDKYTK